VFTPGYLQLSGLYKPCSGRTNHTGWCMNHAPAILATPALIYSTHRLLVVWIIVAHFYLCSLLDRYAVFPRPMRVCCGSRWRRCMLFIMEVAMNTGKRTFSLWATNTGKNNRWISTFHSTGGTLCLSLCRSFFYEYCTHL